MSQVFTCECGRRTVAPYIIRGLKYCTICAEERAPQIVDSRERMAQRSSRPLYNGWQRIRRD